VHVLHAVGALISSIPRTTVPSGVDAGLSENLCGQAAALPNFPRLEVDGIQILIGLLLLCREFSASVNQVEDDGLVDLL